MNFHIIDYLSIADKIYHQDQMRCKYNIHLYESCLSFSMNPSPLSLSSNDIGYFILDSPICKLSAVKFLHLRRKCLRVGWANSTQKINIIIRVKRRKLFR